MANPISMLVVEDNSDLRRFITALLRESGYVVLEAESGEQGLSIVNDRKNSLDLVITDVVMPKMSGSEFVRRLLQVRPGLKVLFMSGYGVTSVDGKVAKMPCFEILRKPFGPADLTQAVCRILGERSENSRVAG